VPANTPSEKGLAPVTGHKNFLTEEGREARPRKEENNKKKIKLAEIKINNVNFYRDNCVVECRSEGGTRARGQREMGTVFREENRNGRQDEEEMCKVTRKRERVKERERVRVARRGCVRETRCFEQRKSGAFYSNIKKPKSLREEKREQGGGGGKLYKILEMGFLSSTDNVCRCNIHEIDVYRHKAYRKPVNKQFNSLPLSRLLSAGTRGVFTLRFAAGSPRSFSTHSDSIPGTVVLRQ
jgi:hypothetical protein